jgi:hypothetical protein
VCERGDVCEEEICDVCGRGFVVCEDVSEDDECCGVSEFLIIAFE